MRNINAEDRVNRMNRRIGEFIQGLTEGRGAQGVPGGAVVRITARLPTEDSPEALLVVKATSEVGDHVAFVGGLDLTQAFLTWAAKDRGTGLKWREDVPWGERGSG